MNIEIVTRNVTDEKNIRGFIEQKLHFALDRIDGRIGHVTVRLEDETRNSPAFDGLCHIDVSMEPRGKIHVSATGESGYDCVIQAIRKVESAIKHDIDRNRRSSKIRHQQVKRDFFASLADDQG